MKGACKLLWRCGIPASTGCRKGQGYFRLVVYCANKHKERDKIAGLAELARSYRIKTESPESGSPRAPSLATNTRAKLGDEPELWYHLPVVEWG